jgi:hypothetical protein
LTSPKICRLTGSQGSHSRETTYGSNQITQYWVAVRVAAAPADAGDAIKRRIVKRPR